MEKGPCFLICSLMDSWHSLKETKNLSLDPQSGGISKISQLRMGLRSQMM